MTWPLQTLTETGSLTELVVKHARDAFASDATIALEWRDLNFTEAPEFTRAVDEYDRLLNLLSTTGASIHMLPPVSGAGLDSIYVRDASVVTPHGMVLCRMGKPQRRGESQAQADAFHSLGIPIAGAITPPGTLEGGDVVWLDATTVVVGQGYRTNAEGIAEFRRILGGSIACVTVPLPHWRGPSDVFHLMSIISPIDDDLALVYSPLMPVPFREWLVNRGMQLVEVPDEEFETMGANVLALAPRQCVAVAGNPRTRERLEAAGVEVMVYEGSEISLKGGGGPTCLTRPIRRLAARGSGREVQAKELEEP